MNNTGFDRRAGAKPCLAFIGGAVLILSLNGCSFIGNLVGIPLGLPACSQSGQEFGVLPVGASDFDSFVPLGNLNPSGHVFPTDHHYFSRQDPTTTFPVFVPGDGAITAFTTVTDSVQGTTEYRIDFRPCDHVRAHFDHLTAVDTSILDEISPLAIPSCNTYSTGGGTFTMCTKNVDIPVNAGDPLGRGGGHTSHGIDFGVYDDRVTNSLVDPQKFKGSEYLNAVSAIPYFDSQDQAILKAATWDYSHTFTRTVSPIGGTISQDIPNTAQGIWFLPGRPAAPEDPHLAFVHDNFDPTIPVLSVGTSVPGLQSAAHTITNVQSSGTSNRDPSAVTADGRIYSYSLSTGVVILQLTTPTELKIEFIPGTPSAPYSFSPNAVVFER